MMSTMKPSRIRHRAVSLCFLLFLYITALLLVNAERFEQTKAIFQSISTALSRHNTVVRRDVGTNNHRIRERKVANEDTNSIVCRITMMEQIMDVFTAQELRQKLEKHSKKMPKQKKKKKKQRTMNTVYNSDHRPKKDHRGKSQKDDNSKDNNKETTQDNNKNDRGKGRPRSSSSYYYPDNNFITKRNNPVYNDNNHDGNHSMWSDDRGNSRPNTMMSSSDNDNDRGISRPITIKASDDGDNDDIYCIRLINDVATDDILQLYDFPIGLLEKHKQSIVSGKLIVTITNVDLIYGRSNSRGSSIKRIETNFNTNYQVMASTRSATTTNKRNDNQAMMRTADVTAPADGVEQEALSLDIAGPIMSILFVRISTMDSVPNYTSQELAENNFNPNGINFMNQYRKCSFGQFQFMKSNFSTGTGVIDVTIPNTITNYTAAGDLITDAMDIMKEKYMLFETPINTLADRVVFCVPPGIGGWAASAGVRHWRVQMNNEWCMSLTALMHEIGHTLGLLHSHSGGDPYGDRTGYMGSGGTNASWPQKCFNAYHTHQFQWYKNRQHAFYNLVSNEPQEVMKLVAFVDYDRTLDAMNEPVSITIDDTFYIQYNRAKFFNRDTEQDSDKVTITQPVETGTDHIAGLGKGEMYQIMNYQNSGLTVIIQVCERYDNYDSERNIDIVMISIAVGKSYCRTFNGEDILRNPSGPIIISPTDQSGRPAPVHQPAHLVLAPTVAPTHYDIRANVTENQRTEFLTNLFSLLSNDNRTNLRNPGNA